MTTQEVQKRNQKAETLKVYQTDTDNFFVESSDGKILYRITFDGNTTNCTCPDYISRSKSDTNFRCKHILAVADSVANHEAGKADLLEKAKPRLDERFLTTINGKDFVTYQGLLDLAHQKGLIKLDVQVLQSPSSENNFEAICQATAESKYGEIFVDIGDANPKNVNSKIAPHIIRMASTRAKARALRDLTNVGITALEELADFSEVIGSDNVISMSDKRPVQAQKERAVKKQEPAKQAEKIAPVAVKTAPAQPVAAAKQPDKPKTETKKAATPDNGSNGNGTAKASEAQKRALYNLARRRGTSVEELARMANDTFHSDVDNLSPGDASALIRQLQQAA